jgi:hypothetical protein
MNSFRTLVIIICVALNQGCVVGDAVALPFRITGAVVNTVAPDVVGDSITSTGDAIDTAIPF